MKKLPEKTAENKIKHFTSSPEGHDSLESGCLFTCREHRARRRVTREGLYALCPFTGLVTTPQASLSLSGVQLLFC